MHIYQVLDLDVPSTAATWTWDRAGTSVVIIDSEMETHYVHIGLPEEKMLMPE